MRRKAWPEAPLKGCLLRIEGGRSPDLPDTPAVAGGWGVLKVSAVHTAGFRPGENKAVYDAGLLDERYEVRPGDLLISRANTPELVGSACIATSSPSRLMMSDKTLRIVVDPSLADPRFVNLCLSSPAVRVQIENAASGSSRSMQNISQRSIERLMLPWPTLRDQHRIVEFFDSVSAVGNSIEASLAKLSLVEDAMALDLLSQLPTVDGASSIGDLGAVVTGMTPPIEWDAVDGHNGIPMITPSQVSSIGEVAGFSRMISPGYRQAVRGVARGATLAVCIGFGVGKVGFVEFDCCTNQQINSVIPHSGMDSRYVYLAVAKAMRLARERVNLQVTPIINKKEFSALSVAVPEFAEQRRVADAVWAVRSSQECLRGELAKLRQLKHGLADDLLTGKVRVSDAV